MAIDSIVVNIQEAKTQLSRLVDRAAAGYGRPVAPDGSGSSGWARGEIVIGADFDAPLPDDIAAAFEGRA